MDHLQQSGSTPTDEIRRLEEKLKSLKLIKTMRVTRMKLTSHIPITLKL